MNRIIAIFNSKLIRVPDHLVKDKYLLQKLAGFVLAEIVLLPIYQFVDQPRLATITQTIAGTTISYTEEKCMTSNTIGGTLLLALNGLVLLNGVRLAIVARNVPNQFNDGKVMGVIVYTMTLLLMVVLLGSLFVTDPRFLLKSISTILIVLCAAAVHTVPKLVQTYAEESVKNSEKQTKHEPGKCPNCGFLDQTKLLSGGQSHVLSTQTGVAKSNGALSKSNSALSKSSDAISPTSPTAK